MGVVPYLMPSLIMLLATWGCPQSRVVLAHGRSLSCLQQGPGGKGSCCCLPALPGEWAERKESAKKKKKVRLDEPTQCNPLDM